jgi:hypothetical protein
MGVRGFIDYAIFLDIGLEINEGILGGVSKPPIPILSYFSCNIQKSYSLKKVRSLFPKRK